MPLHLGMGHHHGDSQEAAREARRFLTTKVRSDWEYPARPIPLPTEQHNSLAPESILASSYAQTEVAPTASLDIEPVRWQEPEYSSNDSYGSETEQSESMDLDGQDHELNGGFKFHSPDSIGQEIDARKLSKKRKREHLLEDEMCWNAGLAHFTAQRNAWTCAKAVGGLDSANGHGTISVPAGATDSSPRSAQKSLDTDAISTSSDSTAQSNNTTTPSSPPTSAMSQQLTASVVLPVPPTLLPDHPIRSRINTSTYSEIYSKIILQARTPTVPINLSHITSSLIQGWKEEGNWPPKGTVVEPPVGRKRKLVGKGSNGNGSSENGSIRHPHLRKGVQAVGRVLGLGIAGGVNNGG